MSEQKHTPGPWALHPTALHPAVRSVGTAETGPRRICTVGTMNGNPVDKENARLIAAAPDLLTALEYAIWAHPELEKSKTVMDAIAKATGGSA